MITSNPQLREEIKKSYPDINIFNIPVVKLVSVNIGIGQFKDDKERIEKVIKTIELLTGQKPRSIKAKKSVSAYKTRQGQIIAYGVTIRGKRAYDFITKLFTVAIPRIRDFRGLNKKNINKQTLNIGFRENIVFPESSYEATSNITGLQAIITLNKYNQKINQNIFELLGCKFQS